MRKLVEPNGRIHRNGVAGAREAEHARAALRLIAVENEDGAFANRVDRNGINRPMVDGTLHDGGEIDPAGKHARRLLARRTTRRLEHVGLAWHERLRRLGAADDGEAAVELPQARVNTIEYPHAPSSPLCHVERHERDGGWPDGLDRRPAGHQVEYEEAAVRGAGKRRDEIMILGHRQGRE